ncbi:hypothetical protein GF1_17110 [Desulfolithobacter dissulfuricans]|uniref:Uncharacterized protein n=1 Tax=Desulfolithobacter dissulfuricans TaxID=2795293 RepID=A0A915UAA6_9BACT|nr:hypothetical protein GF1_17110 [Desulfolithobacter dissulfuricans]
MIVSRTLQALLAAAVTRQELLASPRIICPVYDEQLLGPFSTRTDYPLRVVANSFPVGGIVDPQ